MLVKQWYRPSCCLWTSSAYLGSTQFIVHVTKPICMTYVHNKASNYNNNTKLIMAGSLSDGDID